MRDGDRDLLRAGRYGEFVSMSPVTVRYVALGMMAVLGGLQAGTHAHMLRWSRKATLGWGVLGAVALSTGFYLVLRIAYAF